MGTPISNSISEVYIMQKYLDPKGLNEAGVSHFDAWAANFAKKVTRLEFSPDGNGFRQKTRLSKFNNLPELMTMFKKFTDIKMAEDLNLPEPECEKHTIAVEASPTQKALMKSLGERAEKIHNKEVTPEVDNMLAITTDGTKIGLDQRLINPDFPDFSGSKVNVCVNNVFDIYKDTEKDRLTQMIFCDYSTPKYDGKFSVYEDIKEKLVGKGVPESEIAFIHDCKNNKEKEQLFAKVRSGDVRIILGSTQKMGAGTNCQTKLFAMHHLDPPWKPRDLEQRGGRMKRQGNQNEKVHEYTYVTKDSFDANRFQTLEMKQGYISQIMTNHSPLRSCDDVSPEEISYAEVKAACVGNPMVKEKMELDIDINKLQLLKSSYMKSHYRLEDMILKTLPNDIKVAEHFYNNSLKDIETVKANPVIHNDDGTAIINIRIGNKVYTDKEEAGKALKALGAKLTAANEFKNSNIGSYRGFALEASFDALEKNFKIHIVGENSYTIALGNSDSGNIQRIENAVNNIENRSKGYLDEVHKLESQLEQAKIEYEKPFPQEQELAEKLERKNIVEREIEKQNDDVKINSQEQPEHEHEVVHEYEPVHDRQIVQTDNKRKRDNSMSL